MKALDALRQAQLELDSQSVIAALDHVFAEWRAPDSPWRERLARELELYSERVLEFAIIEGLRDWTAARLRALRSRDIDGPHRVPGVTAVWLGGCIPAGCFSALALPLLAGSAVYAKPASADQVSPRLFLESLRAADVKVAAALAIGHDAGALRAADAVVAYGRDESVATIRAQVPAERIFVGHGHKLSVAAIGGECRLDEAALSAAVDAAIYDGRGCLSPAYVLVDDNPRGRARELASLLSQELDRLRTELPRGSVSAAEHVSLRELRGRWSLREHATVWLTDDESDWAVMLDAVGGHPPPGLLRHVPVIAIDGLDGLASWCKPLAPHLSSLGHSGWGAKSIELPEIVLGAGGSRVCPLGRMQLPPIDWRHDGMSPLRPLLRWVDVEENDPTGR